MAGHLEVDQRALAIQWIDRYTVLFFDFIQQRDWLAVVQDPAIVQEAESLPVQIGRISPGMVVTDFMIDGMRSLPPDHLESFKAIYNLLADPVETVAPFLADGVLAATETGAVIAWLTEEKIQERFSSGEYAGRDLFSRYGL